MPIPLRPAYRSSMVATLERWNWCSLSARAMACSSSRDPATAAKSASVRESVVTYPVDFHALVGLQVASAMEADSGSTARVATAAHHDVHGCGIRFGEQAAKY